MMLEFIVTPETIAAAVTQLRRSERGTQVLRDLRKLLENGGDGLDSENARAFAILAAGCYGAGCSGACQLRDYLQPKKKS